MTLETDMPLVNRVSGSRESGVTKRKVDLAAPDRCEEANPTQEITRKSAGLERCEAAP
jgi:hypothetical protein